MHNLPFMNLKQEINENEEDYKQQDKLKGGEASRQWLEAATGVSKRRSCCTTADAGCEIHVSFLCFRLHTLDIC